MSDPGAARDLASRALAVVVWVLPRHRSNWGQAMLAELAALDAVGERRRYALGCARAVLSDGAALRTVAAHAIALTFAVVAFAFAFSVSVVDVRIETIAFVVGLAALAWSGRRSGPLGPLGEDRLARRIRGGGYAMLGAVVIPALASLPSSGNLEHKGGVWMFYLAVMLSLAAILFVTAQRRPTPTRASQLAPTRTRSLQLAAALTVGGLTAWWVPMLLLASVRAQPGWALLSIAVTVLLGLAIGTVLRWPDEQVGLASLAAGVATCLLIFLAAQSTFLVFPQLVPDVGVVPGMTAAGHLDQNRAEAMDPYVAELFVGALLGALLIATGTATRRGRRTDARPRVLVGTATDHVQGSSNPQ
jgi:hypothetical protein